MFELSFLNTGLLLFATATILPLLIWLLAKRKPKQVVFSSLRFIKLSKDEQKNRAKLRNILLLIIRMLIILLIVLSAARPLLNSGKLKPSAKHPPTALAIVLDTSYSMDYIVDTKSVLDHAKAAMIKINGLSNPTDRIVLITSDTGWNQLHSQIYAGDIPDDLISSLTITQAPLPVKDMLALATKRLKDTQLPNREIYLLTDKQAMDYPQNPELPINLIPLPAPAEYRNLSCADANALPQLVDKSRRQELGFVLQNHGDSERKDVLVKAVLGNTGVAEKFVSIPPRSRIKESLSLEINTEGWQTGYIEVLDERLTPDNRAYFAFPHYLNPRVTVITTRPLPLYLSGLLEVYTGARGKLSISSPASVNATALEDQNLVVIHALDELSPKLRELLGARKAAQKGLLFTLDSRLSAGYRSYLEGEFGLSISALGSGSKNIDFVNPHHYVSSLIAAQPLRGRSVTDYYSASSRSAGATLLSTGKDVLMTAAGSNVLWLFDLSSRRNAFLLDASFPVLAFRSMQFAGSGISNSETRKIGDLVSADAVILPDGKRLELSGNSLALSQSGIYRLSSQNSERALAVNPDLSESDAKTQDFKALKNYRLLGANWQQQIFFTRLGHELWKILLIAALLLVLLEIILVKLEEARPSGNPQGV